MAADSTPPDNGRSTNGIGRAVTNQDLKIMSLELDNKLDRILGQLATMDRQLVAQETRIATMDTNLGARIDANKTEIGVTRTHYHDLAGKVQLIELRTAPFTFESAKELTEAVGYIRQAVVYIKKYDLQPPLSEEERAWVRQARADAATTEESKLNFDRNLRNAVVGAILTVLATALLVPLITGHIHFG